jgi:ankyrin repeat protein
MTLLDYAVMGNHAQMAEALIAAGAEPNSVDKFGFTPLLYAATVDYGDTTVLETLLRAGADPSVKSKDGVTALAQARKYGYREITRLLEAPHR